MTVNHICRASNKQFCRYHGTVTIEATPETDNGRIHIALALTGKSTGLDFGRTTGMDMGALTANGTLTDAAVLTVAKQNAHLYGEDSTVANLADGNFNLAGLKRDINTRQQQLNVAIFMSGANKRLTHEDQVNQALKVWTVEASTRVRHINRDINPDIPPQLPGQGNIRKTRRRNPWSDEMSRAFHQWYPNAA